MTCGACRGRKEKGIKCLLAALDTIKEHALMMQLEAEESAKSIASLQTDNKKLQAHNEKMHRAVDLLKERQESQAIVHTDKRRKVSPKKLKEDISPLPQSQSSLNMNIALSSIDLLSDEDAEEQEEEESIAETEPPSTGSPRKLCKRLYHRKPDVRNLENVQPTSVSSENQGWLRKTPKMMTKLSLTHRGSSLQLKQTRLKFDGSKASGSDKDVIEASPNPSPASKRAPASRSLLQRIDTGNALNGDNSILSKSNIKRVEPSFDMVIDDDDAIDSQPLASLELPVMPPPVSPPHLKMSSSSDSVVLLTPATQDIIFVNDSSEDLAKFGTMDVLAEIMKEDDDACSSALLQYEQIMIDQQKQNQPKPTVQTAARGIKNEPTTQPNEDQGNESTRFSEDIEKYMMEEDDKESDDEIPRPIMVKEEPKLSLKERFDIECKECEKFINFMAPHLNDEKIQLYLSTCKHFNDLNASPPGFWNPHMVSFAEDDPRNEVLIDDRFQRLKK
ncbi:uncharacterized protein DMAD_06064 [Drosophila madeirensis]|uniref:Uncharacterized protein n=1 Tax=Drosophila madeirensis TaxID=30013 RepID=A0AAU9FP33_DROMD